MQSFAQDCFQQRSILFSKKFAELIDDPVQSFGEHNMKGIDEPQAVFALQSE